MALSTLKIFWLLSGLGTVAVAGSFLLSAQPQQQATLARITALDSCLAACNRQRAQQAASILSSLEQDVAKNRSRATDAAVLRQAQQIQAGTQALTDTLQRLRREWLAGAAPAALARLSAQVRQYADTTRRYVPEALPLPDPAPPRTADDWLNQEALATMPRPVGAASFTRLETQVRQLATEAVTQQRLKVITEGVFEKIGVFAAPVSNTVAPGAVYASRLLLVTSSYNRMQMFANGRAVPVDPRTSQGLVTLRVPPARPGQPDTLRAQWQGEVHPGWGGRADTVFPLTVPYFIVNRSQP